MEPKYGTRRKSGTTSAIFGTALGSFALGALLVGYFLWDSGETEPAQLASPEVEQPITEAETEGDTTAPEPIPTATATDAAEAVEAVERVAEQQGGLDQRLAAAEQRLARLDLQAQAAAGNAARAEGMLIAFASRRALERGTELGVIGDQLRLRFGDNWPEAVRTVISFSRDPVRLDQLLARLEGLGPEISERESISSWADIQRELGDLFVIRRESTPSPQPARRLERARYALEQGRYQNAIDEIRNMPGADKAQNWIADAERYRDAMEAMETLELAAATSQVGIRDGAGNPVGEVAEAN